MATQNNGRSSWSSKIYSLYDVSYYLFYFAHFIFVLSILGARSVRGDLGVIRIPAEGVGVGRLGALYNAYTQEFTQVSIFNKPTAENLTRRIGAPLTRAEYSIVRNLDERSGLLHLSGAATLRAMLGIIKGSTSAAGSFLFDISNSKENVVAGLNYEAETDLDVAEIFYEDIKDYISKPILEETQETHVCIAIGYGARFIIQYEDDKGDFNFTVDARTRLEGNLDFALNGAALGIIFPGGLPNWTNTEEGISFGGSIKAAINASLHLRRAFRNYQVSLFGDVSFYGVDYPIDITGMLDAVKKIPFMMKQANDGRGKQMYFYLLPVDKLRKFMKLPPQGRAADPVELSESTTAEILQALEHLEFIGQRIVDLYSLYLENRDVVNNTELVKIGRLRTDFETLRNAFKERLKSEIVQIRLGESSEPPSTLLARMMFEFKEFNQEGVNSLERVLDEAFKDINLKLKLVQVVRINGTVWAGRGDNVWGFILDHYAKQPPDAIDQPFCALHYYHWYLDSSVHFLKFVKKTQETSQVFVIDCDFEHHTCDELAHKRVFCEPLRIT